MLLTIKDVIKSKTMIGVMVFILGISYISASENQNLNIKDNNSISFEQVI